MPPGLQQRKRDLVREAIARAAWDLFAAEGYEATTVADVARAAGVSRRTFFRYFSSKEDVVVGTSDALAEDLLAAFARRPADEPPLAAIHGAIRPILESRLAEPREARAIVRLLRESRTLRRAMLERHARMEERLAALLAERTGADRRRDPTPALLAFVTRALLDTAFNVWYDQRPRDVGAMVDGLFDRLRAVVAAGRKGPRRRRRLARASVVLLLAALGTLAGCGSSGPTSPSPAASPTAVPTPSPAPTLTPMPAPGPPYDRGPAPSGAALEADRGPFAVGTLVVSPSAAVGYGGGAISYPTGTEEGPFGAIAACPGYTGVQRSLQWLGPRLASNGFVVIVIDTLSPIDNAEARAVQLVAALNQVIAFSSTAGHPVFGKVDGNRLAVIGHSYGGGGALLAGTNNPSLKAVVPLAPYYESTSFARLTVPTLVVGCQRDVVAPVAARAIPMYESIPASVSKAYLELAGGDHLCVETGNGNKAVQGKYVVAWAKRFVDEDVRYSPYLCGAPHAADLRGDAVSAYRENCPY